MNDLYYRPAKISQPETKRERELNEIANKVEKINEIAGKVEKIYVFVISAYLLLSAIFTMLAIKFFA